MRVSRSGPSRPTSGAGKAAKSDGAGFQKVSANTSNTADAPRASVTSVGSASGVGAVDAVMALQGADAVGTRRERALRKGRRMLDALDRLQISVLDGQVTEGHLGLLKRALKENREDTGEEGLDEALGHIEVRTAVEIAKLERQSRKSGG